MTNRRNTVDQKASSCILWFSKRIMNSLDNTNSSFNQKKKKERKKGTLAALGVNASEIRGLLIGVEVHSLPYSFALSSLAVSLSDSESEDSTIRRRFGVSWRFNGEQSASSLMPRFGVPISISLSEITINLVSSSPSYSLHFPMTRTHLKLWILILLPLSICFPLNAVQFVDFGKQRTILEKWLWKEWT